MFAKLGMVDVNAKTKWRLEGNARGKFYRGPKSDCSDQLKQDSVPRMRIIHQIMSNSNRLIFPFSLFSQYRGLILKKHTPAD
jgi:hypothetical protein